jgi:peptidylprolyl isomerase
VPFSGTPIFVPLDLERWRDDYAVAIKQGDPSFMRFIASTAALLTLGLTAACSGSDTPGEATAAASRGEWRPAPVENAVEPSETIANAPDSAWREVAPENLLLMDLADGGRVAIELAPDFAPVHVANIQRLARGGWWNGASIYRVQDNYVVQWGVNEGDQPLPEGVIAAPPAEYHRPLEGLAVRPLGYPDSYAPMVGHAGGWPIGYDPQSGRAWLAHCYGMVGVGRELSPDTGTGGELYAVIGHAPRHLDRNIALVGRVVDGMEHLTARPRGTEALGFYKEETQHIPIVRAALAADSPAAQRPAYEVMRSGSEAFSAYITGRANRGGDFFDVPAGGVDLCNALVPTRKVD